LLSLHQSSEIRVFFFFVVVVFVLLWLLLPMAKLLSELEKFEQEMRELGSDISPLTDGAGAPLPHPSPLPPRLPPPNFVSPPSVPQVRSRLLF
jgi:hypothetical protein